MNILVFPLQVYPSLLCHVPGKRAMLPCTQGGCSCKGFSWIPSRPEEVGEFWFQRRRNFDPRTWKAKCRCKHSHSEHDPVGMRRCKAKGKGTGSNNMNMGPTLFLLGGKDMEVKSHPILTGCKCNAFDSNFLCAACDRHWEQHDTFFETEEERKQNGLPVGWRSLSSQTRHS